MNTFTSVEDAFLQSQASPANSDLISRVAMLDTANMPDASQALMTHDESMRALFTPANQWSTQPESNPQFVQVPTDIPYLSAEVVDDSNFNQKVLKSDKPAIVLFSIYRCGLCTRLKNTAWQTLLRDYSDRFNFFEFLCNGQSQTEDEYMVNKHPNIFVFNQGKEIDHYMGYAPEDSYINFIKYLKL